LLAQGNTKRKEKKKGYSEPYPGLLTQKPNKKKINDKHGVIRRCGKKNTETKRFHKKEERRDKEREKPK